MAILGTVVSINGAPDAVDKVVVISDGGVKRVLHLNDGVKTGDTIITPEGVIVELELANGKPLAIFAGQTVKVTDELADAVPASSGDSAIDQATIQAVITAINEGRDISDVLEETAAGLDGGAVTAYGFGFEILPRIIEGLNPLAFDFASNRTDNIDIQPLFSEENDFLSVANTGTSATTNPVPTIASVSSETEAEGSSLVHTVTLSNPSAVATTYAFSLSDNTATGGSVD